MHVYLYMSVDEYVCMRFRNHSLANIETIIIDVRLNSFFAS